MRGRRVVITGVGGIGAETARQIIARGGRVHLVDVEADAVASLAANLGCGRSVADLRTRAEVDRAFGEAVRDLGAVDGLVAIAGGSGRRFGDGPVHELDETALARTMELNVTPAALALGAFLRHRDDSVRGSAVITGSVLARYPHPLFATHGYAAAKAALEGLCRAAASYYAESTVTVNVIAPGLTRTPMSTRAQEDAETVAFAQRKQPLAEDGFVDAAHVAEAITATLANPAITGQVLAVDAGWSVR